MSDDDVRALLATLPDVPRWVEVRAGLLGGWARVEGPPCACVVRWHEGDDDDPMLAAVGRPGAATLLSAVRADPGADLLASPDECEYVASVLGRPGRGAALHVLAPGVALAAGEGGRPTRPGGGPAAAGGDAGPAAAGEGVRLLGPADEPLACAVPEADVRAELLAALRRVPVAAAFDGGRPVAFCYAGSVTETLWDVSIDTLAGFRRRGLAARAFAAMAEHLRARGGLAPVWGAYDDNVASLGLARKLGFVPVDRLFVFEAAGGRAAPG